jgi:hypothetical protein
MEPIVKHYFRIAFVSLLFSCIIECTAAVFGYQKIKIGPGFLEAGRLLFFHGFILLALAGFIYHMLPKLMGSFLWSKKLQSIHLLMIIFGVGGSAAIHLLLGVKKLLPATTEIPMEYIPLAFIVTIGLKTLGNTLFVINLLKSFNYKGKIA